jgi:hypothetical protein
VVAVVAGGLADAGLAGAAGCCARAEQGRTIAAHAKPAVLRILVEI